MLSPQQLFARLDALGLAHRSVEHAPVFTVEEARAHRGELPGHHIKNLFLRNKKEEMWLVVALEDRAIDLKRLGEMLGAGRLSFGSPDRLRRTLGVEPGSVTPFAVINDDEHRVKLVLDRALGEGGPVNAHPLTNTMTTAITFADLARFFEATGHSPQWLDFPL
ncbi:prolyl-tRNA synthetase associated domain-containing protein [Enhydrobacter sp.]|jgi:Ala-tRNA(Pro) deacylase|uniref:prolyl-tRNA synthetase associated domain-containing protein n=1 Tax=Enhydrobacter sp. TaxID=1894999 RepID=UPI002614B184|nr:prolyl-tRNA synthetase associated domain-containing protein [Enhydrobacter sp.]WIM10847.1 MAG: prolyl-tRNA synthetase associated domain-containing protein [Enhydrobacter sp.]